MLRKRTRQGAAESEHLIASGRKILLLSWVNRVILCSKPDSFWVNIELLSNLFHGHPCVQQQGDSGFQQFCFPLLLLEQKFRFSLLLLY